MDIKHNIPLKIISFLRRCRFYDGERDYKLRAVFVDDDDDSSRGEVLSRVTSGRLSNVLNCNDYLYARCRGLIKLLHAMLVFPVYLP